MGESRSSLTATLACGVALVVGAAYWIYASSQSSAAPADSAKQPAAQEGVAQVVDAPRETAAAAIFATNAVRLTEEATPGPASPLDTRALSFVRPQRPAGDGVILEGGVPDSTGSMIRHNEWVGYLDDRVVWLVAGERRSEVIRQTVEGELAIAFFDRRDGRQVDVQRLSAPKGVGPLAVLDVDGTNIILTGTEKPVVVFDLTAMSFLPDEKAAAYSERRIGDATVRLTSPEADVSGAGGIAWQILVPDGSNTDALELRGPGQGTGWNLSAGQGATPDEASRAMRPVSLESQPFQMRVFDVRGHTILFVENYGVITYYDMDKGAWNEGIELAGAQPDYLAKAIPEFTSLWVDNATQTPAPLPAYP